LIPHPPNFTPITAMALFGGAVFSRRWMGVALPLLALVLSDLVLGFHVTALAVYLSFVVVAIIGFGLRENRSALRVGGAALLGSTAFFAITNFAVWALSGIYPHTTEGFIAAYVMALPFFENAIIGDLLFTGALFGAWAWISNRYPALSFERSEAIKARV
jgi:hypothetical protein